MSYTTLLSNQVADFLAGQDTVVFDHRDARSFATGHIQGAMSVTEENIGRLIKGKHYDRPILIYCYHGIGSRELCNFLVKRGFRKVFNLEGGWQAWSIYENSLQASLSDELQHWLGMNGFDCNIFHSRIKNGMTNLMLATLKGKAEFVSELINAGVDVNLSNDDGNNALWFACRNSDLAMINLLIEYGIDIDNQNVNGATALIYAASAGKIAVVKLLTDNKANLHKKTLDDFTALDSAASLPVLKFLKPRYSQAISP